MNGKVILAAVAAASALCACQSSSVRIAGRIVGNEARSSYLEQVTPLSERIIDSAQLDKEGNYRFELREAPASPSLYNVVYDGERIPLLLAEGDRLTLSSVGSVARNYTVEGSAESELLRQFYQNYVAGVQRLDEIAQQVARQEAGEQHDELVKAYTEEYYRIRREQLRFIIENKSSLAALFALYQRLPGDANLFNGDSDVVYYRTVAEALEKSYPDSPYLPVLLAEIGRMDARLNLASQLTVTGYPDLELSNIYGKKVRLSSLEGKVILVDFWSAELGNGNARNAELKELYRKYERAGAPFEIYQVAIDTSKPLWITAVQEQQLPWVSVSDLQGGASPTLKLYNVQRLPTSFLISREGEIVARDLDGEELARKIEELLQ